ncbi:MAG: TetR/AcrR family transcriptional regulator [Kurthia sp.]|nr:TetR/AcrR family transcriptional regulator [Candidatus Kurthia equi]
MEGYEYLDRRIVKTRDVLKAALMESLQYTQLSQISITDLTTVANINRSTFYSHYTDKYDLLDAAIEQYASIKFRTRQNFETINETILKEIFIDVAIVLQEMKTTYKLNYHVISLIVEKKIKYDLQQLFQKIEQKMAKDYDEKTIHISSVMLSWGIYGAALDWVDHDGEDAESYISSVIPTLLNGLTSM